MPGRCSRHSIFPSASDPLERQGERLQMAKKSMVLREEHRLRTVKRYAKKRIELKAIIQSPSSSDEERQDALARLQALPRDANPIRLRNRCAITGRPKGFFRKFGLARNKLREQAMAGNIPGLTKASW